MTGKMREGNLPAMALGSIDGFRIFLAVIREVFMTIMGFFGILDLFGPGEG